MVMSGKALQSAKQPQDNSLTELGILTEVRLVQPRKQYWSINVTEFGMSMEFKLEQ